MLIFSHIPKTAGTSFKNILRMHYGCKHIDALKTRAYPYALEDLRFAEKIFRKPQAISGHNLIDPTENLCISEAKYITMLREPLARTASHYQYAIQRLNYTGPFKQWMLKPENANLSVQTIAGAENLERAKLMLKDRFLFCGFTEYYVDSIKLLKILSKENFQLQEAHFIEAKDNRIKQEILHDPNSLELLEKYNQLDIQLYNFALKEIFLPLREQYASYLQEMQLHSGKTPPAMERKRKRSKRFNQFVYRQAIKIRGK